MSQNDLIKLVEKLTSELAVTLEVLENDPASWSSETLAVLDEAAAALDAQNIARPDPLNFVMARRVDR